MKFNWKLILMRIIVNMLAIGVTSLILPGLRIINRGFVTWLILAIGIGLLNAVIKPILQFLMFRFLFVSFGLVIIIINAILLILLTTFFSDRIVIESLFTVAFGGTLISLISILLESALGMSAPILDEAITEIVQRQRHSEFSNPVGSD